MDTEAYARENEPRFEQIIELLSLDASESISVLAVGIKPYVFTEVLLKRYPNVELAGINFGDPDAVETVEIAGQSVDVRHCNVEEHEWPYPDEQFDRVVLGEILEHLFDPYAALVEARRVLRSDGSLVVTTPNAVRLRKRFRTLRGINPFAGLSLESKYNRHNHEWTERELRDILEVAGLQPDKFEQVNNYRTNLVPKVLGKLSTLHPRLHDTFVVRSRKTDPIDRQPIVYRQGLTEDKEWDAHA
jgi:SAM-dependent methyltransferase